MVQHGPEVRLPQQIQPILVLLMIPVTSNKTNDQDKQKLMFARMVNYEPWLFVILELFFIDFYKITETLRALSLVDRRV